MITTLELQQFRGLEHVKFENLGRANLIIGGNNTGKTSVLEALVLMYGNKRQLELLPTCFRAQPKGTKSTKGFWNHLLMGNSAGMKAKTNTTALLASLKSDVCIFARSPEGSPSPTPFIKVHENGHLDITDIKSNSGVSIVSTNQVDPGDISELFNQVAPLDPNNETKLEELIKLSIEPRLRRLRYAKPQGTQVHLIYADLGIGRMLPFTQLGQAFGRTIQVYCEIFAKRPKILLVDEIENGLYYEGFEDYWKGLMAVLEDQDVQLFATTHSRECMEAAHRAASAMDGDPLRFLRLDRRVDDPGKIVATTFGKEEMATAIEFNREMR